MSGNVDLDLVSKLTEQSFAEIVRQDYADRWGEAERYRTRAQTAFTISTTIAAALGVTGILAALLSNQPTTPNPVLWLGGATFVAWSVAAGLALFAASYAAPEPETKAKPGEILQPLDYAKQATTRLKSIKDTLRKRTQATVIALAVALVFTVGLLVTSLALPKSVNWAGARIVLSKERVAAMDQLCARHFSPVDVRIDESTVDASALRAEFPKGSCRPDEKVDSEIPREDVQGIVWVP